MKSTLYFLALSVSLIFTACSSNEQEIHPLSPQLEKVEINSTKSPYNYLQAFEEVKNLKLSYHQEKDGLYLLINTGSQRINHLYAVIEQQGKLISTLIFLGSSDEQKYFIKGFNPVERFNIRIYGLFNNKVKYIMPYPQSTIMDNIPVNGWGASDRYIKVSSAKFPVSLVHLFTELKTKKGNILVFLAKPEWEDFEIPKYGEYGVYDLNLFGYSTKSFTEK
jgi:hypothetical protein